MARGAPIDRPNLLWRGFVLGGVGTMAAVSVSDRAWRWWRTNVTPAVPRNVIRGVLGATVAVHLAEGTATRRVVRRAHLAHAGAYTRSSLVYGFPAYRRAVRAALDAIPVGEAVPVPVAVPVPA